MADRDAEEFAQAVAAAADADQELERLRVENAELRDDAERWAHIAGIARGVLQQRHLIADTLARHRAVEVPVRTRWWTVGYRHDCLCGWQSETYRRRDRRTRAVALSAATNHAARQIVEALEVVAAAECESAERPDHLRDSEQGHGGGR